MARRGALLWSGPALDDLREIRAYVARDDKATAKRLADRIRAAVMQLRLNPRSGRVVPEMEARGYRELIIPPYRIVYEVQPKGVLILAVWHSRQSLDAPHDE